MKKIKIIFLITGFIILAVLFQSFGVEATFSRIRAIGWRFFLITGIFFFTNMFLTMAWWIIIPYDLKKSVFWKFMMARLAGDATTSINAISAFAGEPLKALYVRDILPLEIGLASVILDRMIRITAGILTSMTGIFVALFIAKIPYYLSIGMLLACIIMLFAFFHTAKNHSAGFFEYLLRFAPGRLLNKFMDTGRWEKIKAIDQEINRIFTGRENLNHFYISLALHYFAIIISCTLEIYLIAGFLEIGAGFTMLDAAFVYIFGLILTSIIFFMPANIGTSEGSYSLALSLLGFDPVFGLSIGIIRRLRTLVWSAVGIIILFHAGLMKKDKDKTAG